MTDTVIEILQDYLDTLDNIASDYGWSGQEKLCAKFAGEEILANLNKNRDVPPLLILEKYQERPWLLTRVSLERFLLWNMTSTVCRDIIDILIN